MSSNTTWSDVRLGDLVDIKHGFAFKGEHFTDIPNSNVLLTPGNFRIGGGFKDDKLKYYSGTIDDEYVLREGDLIVTMTDLSKAADTLGYPALIPYTNGKKYLHNQRIGRILIKNPEALDIRFLYYVLCSRRYRNEVLASLTGTTVKHTSPKKIGAYTFALPPLAVQRQIARILGSLDDKIVLNRQMNSTLESTARAFFNSWLVDFDPVKAKVKGQKPIGMHDEMASHFPDNFDETKSGGIPRGWQIQPLDKIANFLNGLALQKYPASENSWLPVIKIAEMRRGNTIGSDRASAGIPQEYVVQDGDVLFSWSGSLEVVLWCGAPGALNQHLFKVTSASYPKWFFFFWIRHHLAHFRSIAEGKATTMGHIQRHHLSEAKTLVPPPALLSQMTKVMQPLVDTFISQELESRTLGSLRDTLLPRLLSGEIPLQHNKPVPA